jgi:L-threonylcarbamoyladenylate synthase
LVAFPTETVYGIGASAYNDQAVKQIYIVKNRSTSDPIIVHIAQIEQLEEVASEVPGIAFEIAENFWPGPLTLVLKRNKNVAKYVSAGLDTVAVRMSRHNVPLQIINLSKTPIAAPSANIFTRPSSTIAQHVIDDLFGKIDLIIDGGICEIGLESTVLDLTNEIPTILRPGGTPIEMLRETIPDITYLDKYIDAMHAEGMPSPGMLSKHYSPKTQFVIFSGGSPIALANLRKIIMYLLDNQKQIGLLLPNEEQPFFADLPIQIRNLGSKDDLSQIAQNLFVGIRDLDKANLDVIIMRSVDKKGLGVAIWDRLSRASGQKVFDLDREMHVDEFRWMVDR